MLEWETQYCLTQSPRTGTTSDVAQSYGERKNAEVMSEEEDGIFSSYNAVGVLGGSGVESSFPMQEMQGHGFSP